MVAQTPGIWSIGVETTFARSLIIESVDKSTRIQIEFRCDLRDPDFERKMVTWVGQILAIAKKAPIQFGPEMRDELESLSMTWMAAFLLRDREVLPTRMSDAMVLTLKSMPYDLGEDLGFLISALSKKLWEIRKHRGLTR